MRPRWWARGPRGSGGRGIPGRSALPARGQLLLRGLAIKKGAKSCITQFAALQRRRSPPPVRLRLLSQIRVKRRRNCKRSDGVQLRRHQRRGGHVPQHDPHGGRGVVPARDAAELLVHVLRQPRPRRRRQVRLRAGDARRVLQVPPPPHQLPGPRPPPPVPADLPGRSLRRYPAGCLVLRLLPHR